MRTPLKERGLVDIRTIIQQHIAIRFCISSDDHDDDDDDDFNEPVDEKLAIMITFTTAGCDGFDLYELCELVDEELTIIMITCGNSCHPGGAIGQVEESNVRPLLALITIEPKIENVDHHFQTFEILTFTRQDYGLGIVAIFFHVPRVCFSSS